MRPYKRKQHELIEESYGAGVVDRGEKVIRGVKVLGKVSKHGRRYSDRALQDAARLAEGVRVHLDHDRGNGERKIDTFIGTLKNVRVKDDGNYADLHYLESHSQASAIVERAERFPDTFGLSHHAFGPLRTKNGAKVVESIESMMSVDLVDRPATNSSLFEDEGETMMLKEYVESIDSKDKAWLTELIEQDEVLADVPIDEPAAEMGADEQMKAAFRSMVMAAFDDESLDTQATLSRIREILKSQEKLMGGDKEEEPAEETEEPEGETMESLKAENARLKAENDCRRLLESAGVPSDDVKLKAMAALDDDERKTLVESWSVEKTNGRPKPDSKPLRESEGIFAKDHKSFITSIKR